MPHSEGRLLSQLALTVFAVLLYIWDCVVLCEGCVGRVSILVNTAGPGTGDSAAWVKSLASAVPRDGGLVAFIVVNRVGTLQAQAGIRWVTSATVCQTQGST